MNFSDISFFKKKSEESDSKTEKDIKIMNLNVKNISKNNDLILSLKRFSSYPILIFSNAMELYSSFKNKKKIYQKTFLFEINKNFVNSKFSCKKINQILNGNRTLYGNKNVNIDTHLSNMSTNDSLSLLLIKTKNTYVNFEFSKKNFCDYIPKKNEMKDKASQKPSFFPEETFLGINRFQNEIGSKDYLCIKDYFFCSKNDSYKIIDKKPHFLTNHFLYKKNKIQAVNIRYRHKNVVFVYFK